MNQQITLTTTIATKMTISIFDKWAKNTIENESEAGTKETFW